jgi:hypothetical protein
MGVNHLYSWVASAFAAWTLWSELQPIAVADGLAIFGLLLFECGDWQKQKQLRLQAYVLLTLAFGRIFFANLTAASLPNEVISPRIYTIVPIAVINIFIWAQLQSGKESDGSDRLGLESSWAGNLLAWFGTGAIAALLYYETARNGSSWHGRFSQSTRSSSFSRLLSSLQRSQAGELRTISSAGATSPPAAGEETSRCCP